MVLHFYLGRHHTFWQNKIIAFRSRHVLTSRSEQPIRFRDCQIGCQIASNPVIWLADTVIATSPAQQCYGIVTNNYSIVTNNLETWLATWNKLTTDFFMSISFLLKLWNHYCFICCKILKPWISIYINWI